VAVGVGPGRAAGDLPPSGRPHRGRLQRSRACFGQRVFC